MAERTDPVLFAMGTVRFADTPTERARAYRTLGDLFEAGLISRTAAVQLMDALDRTAPMGEVLGMDEQARVN